MCELFLYLWFVVGRMTRAVIAPVALVGLGGAGFDFRQRRVLRLPHYLVVMLAAIACVGHVAGVEPVGTVVAPVYLQHPAPHAQMGAFPVVVTCQRTHGQLMGTAIAGQTTAYLAPVTTNATQVWAKGQPFGTWVVDSGAELVIAGAFMYQYARVLQLLPPVSVRGVDGELTPVDALVRTVARLPEGDYLIREVLMCDPFQIALWSTEYMGGFGFAHVFETSDKPSYVRTPRDHRIPLEHRPYRMILPCRAPTPDDEISANAYGSVHAYTSATTTVIGRASHRLVSVGEAWALHSVMMHAGWSSIAATFQVRVPPMPPCDTCHLTQSKRVSHKSHGIVST